MQKHQFVYAILIQSYQSIKKISISAVITFVENFDDVAKKMSSKFKEFEDVFSLKKDKILTRQKKNVDHVIELKDDKQFLYESLYNLFNFELKTL